MVRFVIFLFLATVYTTAFPQEKLKWVPRNSLVETPIETPNGEMQRKQVDLTRFTFHARDLAEFGKAFVAEKGREGLLEEQRFSDELPDIGSSRGGNYRSPWAVNFFGISSHPGKNGNPRVNNANWGAGLRYYQTRNWFYESNIMRNTKRGQMLTAGAGYEFNVFSIASHPISLGAELFVVAYEVQWQDVLGIYTCCFCFDRFWKLVSIRWSSAENRWQSCRNDCFPSNSLLISRAGFPGFSFY